MSCFPCCASKERIKYRKALQKSSKEYHASKSIASFANISFKSDARRQRYITEEIMKIGNGNNITAKIFSYRELRVATQNFHQDNLIGEGGFGRVYKGFLESLNQVVAVKQLDRNGFQETENFSWRILVYEYMVNGSLEDHLLDLVEDRKPLDWSTRMKIAQGASKGLEYLHEVANPPMIYRDFKASNILLDEDFNPKLSDFGLAKLGPTGEHSHVSTRVMGTYGYCAPENDILRRVVDHSKPTEEQNLVLWAQPLLKDKRKFTLIIDPLLEDYYPVKVSAMEFLAKKNVNGDDEENDEHIFDSSTEDDDRDCNIGGYESDSILECKKQD
ncbi:hypothetical protein K1719_035828 [Acacia pycnantha]|nr:hypothetical protein K1719_035828 [Acacia pycnantha]